MIRSKSCIGLVCRTCIPNRGFSFTIPTFLNQKYRKERGLPLNPNVVGILTDSPDFSYLDGRLTPLGPGQRRRVLRQQEVKNKIITLSKEIDFAIGRHEELLQKEENRKQWILDRKLKPKGITLLGSTEV